MVIIKKKKKKTEKKEEGVRMKTLLNKRKFHQNTKRIIFREHLDDTENLPAKK